MRTGGGMNSSAVSAPTSFPPIPLAPRICEGVGGVSLELFGQVPSWAVVHAARDNRNAPLIRRGEIAIVESDGAGGWIPTDGGIFLIEYVSLPQARYERVRRSREIVKTFLDSRGQWRAGSLRQGIIGNTIYVSDGPYDDPNELSAKRIGRVAGLYLPSLAGGVQ